MSFFGKVAGLFRSSPSAAPEAPPTKPNGSDGVVSYGGYLVTGEQSRALQGKQKWVTYSNATNAAVVATGVRYFANLLAGTEWHCEPNERGGKDAERGVDIVTQGLLTAQMPRPWSTVVRKAAMFRFHGFSLHEWTTKRRDDGMVVFADIAHRPQDTIERWFKPDERLPWTGVEQWTRSGKRYPIPRNRLFYCADDTLTDSPDGVGLLRHVVELVRRLNVLEGLEGVGYETDLRGMPLGSAPLKELLEESGLDVKSPEARAYVASKTQTLRAALENVIKSPEQLQWLLLDSGTYKGLDPNVITAVKKWAFELLRGDAKGLPEINIVIERLQFEIARVLGIEFALVGSGASGSRALHEDKTNIFATNLQATLSEIASFATNDLARVLIAFNGLDPDTCTPRLVAEPISTDSLEQVTRSLANIALAGLAPNDEARDVLRKRLRLPPEPKPTADQLGLLRRSRSAPGPAPAPAPPDPAKGEIDVPVDDLGPGKKAA